MSDLYVDELETWDALRLDLVGAAPVDRDYVEQLILGAQGRLSALVGKELSEFEGGLPDVLKRAITVDVTVHYFNRTNPELPSDYDELVMPYRKWGFGG